LDKFGCCQLSRTLPVRLAYVVIPQVFAMMWRFYTHFWEYKLLSGFDQYRYKPSNWLLRFGRWRSDGEFVRGATPFATPSFLARGGSPVFASKRVSGGGKPRRLSIGKKRRNAMTRTRVLLRFSTCIITHTKIHTSRSSPLMILLCNLIGTILATLLIGTL